MKHGPKEVAPGVQKQGRLAKLFVPLGFMP